MDIHTLYLIIIFSILAQGVIITLKNSINFLINALKIALFVSFIILLESLIMTMLNIT